jgi:hypothetical protein
MTDTQQSEVLPATVHCQECGRELQGCYEVRKGVVLCLMCSDGKCHVEEPKPATNYEKDS